MKILVSAEIGGGAALRAPVEWGFVVLSNDQKVADGRHREAPAPGATVDANAYVTLNPGSYRLRFGATDGSGRAGSIDIPLSASPRRAPGTCRQAISWSASSSAATSVRVLASRARPTRRDRRTVCGRSHDVRAGRGRPATHG